MEALQVRSVLDSLTKQTMSVSEISSKEQARSEAFRILCNQFTGLSKKKFVDEQERDEWENANIVILQKLHGEQFTFEQFCIAEQWILKGDPCKYREFTFQDFYPTDEQLETLGLNIQSRIDKAYERGEAAGYGRGYNAASREYEQDTERLRLLSETKDQSEINNWKLRLDSREKEIETRLASITEREQKCLEFERIESKRLAFITTTSNQ